MASSSAAVPFDQHQWDIDQGRQNGFITAVSILVGLGTVVVLLRIGWRQFYTRMLGVDDLFMAVAWVLTIGYFGDIMVLRDNGVGHQAMTLTPTNFLKVLKATFALEIIYYCIVYCIKVSILFLYLRFVVSQKVRTLCFGTIGLLSVFVLVCIIVTVFQCTPVHKAWDFTGTVPGHCINTTAFFYSTSAFNIITDIWILYLPIPTLWGIQRPAREKVALLVVFGIGAFSCTASIIRLHTIYKYTLAKDPIQEAIAVNLWSMIEVNIGMICASLPALKQVLSVFNQRRHGISTGASGGKASSGKLSSGRSGKTTRSITTIGGGNGAGGRGAHGRGGIGLEKLPSVSSMTSRDGGHDESPAGGKNHSTEHILRNEHHNSARSPPERLPNGRLAPPDGGY